MWDLIVSVPDHCLSFYFESVFVLVRYIFNFHSNKANFKFLYFVVYLQQFFKHIDTMYNLVI